MTNELKCFIFLFKTFDTLLQRLLMSDNCCHSLGQIFKCKIKSQEGKQMIINRQMTKMQISWTENDVTNRVQSKKKIKKFKHVSKVVRENKRREQNGIVHYQICFSVHIILRSPQSLPQGEKHRRLPGKSEHSASEEEVHHRT